MSLYSAYSKYEMFGELATPLATQEGVLSAATQRLRAVRNLFGDTDIAADNIAGLSIATPGTVEASKFVQVDANKDVSVLRNVGVTNLDAGASGTAGTVDVFPTTAAKGKIAITAADSAGDTTTTLVNASQSGARTYTIPDAGASASFVMTEGAQTVNGAKTIPALNTTNLDAGASGTAGTVDVFPTTAAKGKIALTAADSAGDTTTTIVNASQAGARTYTIPDAGASADFVLAPAGVEGAVTPTAVQQDLSGAGAVTLTEFYTAVTNTGADALTLADSTVLGQLKKVKMIVDPGTDSTLTFNGTATIVFADVGDYAVLIWNGSDWIPIELGNDADGATAPVYTPA